MKNRLKNLLNAGDRLELSIEGKTGSALTLETAFVALIDSDKLVIRAAVHDTSLSAAFTPFIKLKACKDAAGILEMNGRIIESSRTGADITLVVALSENIHQIQRRQDYRLPLLREIRLGNSGIGYYDGLTQNISAGGLRCILPTRMRPGTRIGLKVELSRETLELEGEVLETFEFDEELQRHIFRIRFVDVPEKIRSRLTAYIFSEQSRQNKKFDR